MSKKCPKCGSVDIIQNGKYKDGSVGYKCRKCGEMFILLTLFNRITASPEVLAEVLVYESPGYNKKGDKDVFYRSKVDKFWMYTTREEAIATTVAKLKELEK